MEQNANEWNFDGLVGPTHNYAGLSVGNVASIRNAKSVSNPRAAALQGLEKMWSLHELGLPQGILAPQARPDLASLRALGFSGTDSAILEKASQQTPQLLAACFSASSMWTANAATVSPSADCHDGKLHFTPANLTSKFHRSLEASTTQKILRAVFKNENYFTHHPPLPSADAFADEGAANHTRFCHSYGDAGVEFFVYGRVALDSQAPTSKKFPARQTREASEAIARTHGLDSAVFAQQNPAVIDQGVFHNDVIAVGNRDVLFAHAEAFLNSADVLRSLEQKLNGQFKYLEVTAQDVPVSDAVYSYLFNSQLVTLPNGDTAIITPEESRKNERVWNYLQKVMQDGSIIQKIHVFNVTESMQNGGGPACLRLRVVLTAAEAASINPACILTAEKYAELKIWVTKHYRDRLSSEDFCDLQFLQDTQTALDELTQILALGSIYPFQRVTS